MRKGREGSRVLLQGSHYFGQQRLTLAGELPGNHIEHAYNCPIWRMRGVEPFIFHLHLWLAEDCSWGSNSLDFPVCSLASLRENPEAESHTGTCWRVLCMGRYWNSEFWEDVGGSLTLSASWIRVSITINRCHFSEFKRSSQNIYYGSD